MAAAKKNEDSAAEAVAEEAALQALIQERAQILQMNQIAVESMPEESLKFMMSPLVQRSLRLAFINGILAAKNAMPPDPAQEMVRDADREAAATPRRAPRKKVAAKKKTK